MGPHGHSTDTRAGAEPVGPGGAGTLCQRPGLTFPLVFDPDGKINALYGVVGLPTTFVVGRDGRAIAFAIGPRQWESAPARALIEALLAEPASGPAAQ